MKLTNLNHIIFLQLAIMVLTLGAMALSVLMPFTQVVTVIVLSVGASIMAMVTIFSVANMRDMLQHDSNAIGRFIKGDYDSRVVPFTNEEPIGAMQHRINNLLDIVDIQARDKEALIDEVTDGDYYRKIYNSPLMQSLIKSGANVQITPTITPAAPVAPSALSATLKSSTNSLLSLTAELERVSSSLGSATADSPTDTESVIRSAEQAKDNVQTVAAAAEELSYSIREISERVDASNRIASKAVEHAKQSNEIVNGLNSASDKIGDVVKLITSIAGQTNLLALNATIEAARAGEAGRGFAVVASEVKHLADQTARATEEIAEQIKTIQSSTGSAVTAIQEIGNTITQISEISTAILVSVNEQSEATNEISRNIQLASDGTKQVAENIQLIGKSSSDSDSADKQKLIQISNQISEQAAVLNADLDELSA